MSLTKGKHIVQEIEGVLCTLVEKGIDTDRLKFLKRLLEFNNFEVKVAEVKGEEGQPSTYTIGVTSLVFNPVIAVYEKSLKHQNGKKVSPASWNQVAETEYLPYFDYREKNPDAENQDDFVTNPWSYRTV